MSVDGIQKRSRASTNTSATQAEAKAAAFQATAFNDPEPIDLGQGYKLEVKDYGSEGKYYRVVPPSGGNLNYGAQLAQNAGYPIRLQSFSDGQRYVMDIFDAAAKQNIPNPPIDLGQGYKLEVKDYGSEGKYYRIVPPPGGNLNYGAQLAQKAGYPIRLQSFSGGQRYVMDITTVVQPPSQAAIEQSRRFNAEHVLDFDDHIQPGYRDGGRGLQFDDQGRPLNTPSREIIVVRPANQDPAYARVLEQAKNATANMTTTAEKVAYVNRLVESSMAENDPYTNERRMDQMTGGDATGKEISLGQLIDANTGVCRHRSLLMKALCDDLGIRTQLVRGNWYNWYYEPSIRGSGGGHAWNVVQLEDGSRMIVDVMHQRQFRQYPDGSWEKGAERYTDVNNNQLYTNSARPPVAKENINHKSSEEFEKQTGIQVSQSYWLPGEENDLSNRLINLQQGRHYLNPEASQISEFEKAQVDKLWEDFSKNPAIRELVDANLSHYQKIDAMYGMVSGYNVADIKEFIFTDFRERVGQADVRRQRMRTLEAALGLKPNTMRWVPSESTFQTIEQATTNRMVAKLRPLIDSGQIKASDIKLNTQTGQWEIKVPANLYSLELMKALGVTSSEVAMNYISKRTSVEDGASAIVSLKPEALAESYRIMPPVANGANAAQQADIESKLKPFIRSGQIKPNEVILNTRTGNWEITVPSYFSRTNIANSLGVSAQIIGRELNTPDGKGTHTVYIPAASAQIENNRAAFQADLQSRFGANNILSVSYDPVSREYNISVDPRFSRDNLVSAYGVNKSDVKHAGNESDQTHVKTVPANQIDNVVNPRSGGANNPNARLNQRPPEEIGGGGPPTVARQTSAQQMLYNHINRGGFGHVIDNMPSGVTHGITVNDQAKTMTVEVHNNIPQAEVAKAIGVRPEQLKLTGTHLNFNQYTVSQEDIRPHISHTSVGARPEVTPQTEIVARAVERGGLTGVDVREVNGNTSVYAPNSTTKEQIATALGTTPDNVTVRDIGNGKAEFTVSGDIAQQTANNQVAHEAEQARLAEEARVKAEKEAAAEVARQKREALAQREQERWAQAQRQREAANNNGGASGDNQSSDGVRRTGRNLNTGSGRGAAIAEVDKKAMSAGNYANMALTFIEMIQADLRGDVGLAAQKRNELLRQGMTTAGIMTITRAAVAKFPKLAGGPVGAGATVAAGIPNIYNAFKDNAGKGAIETLVTGVDAALSFVPGGGLVGEGGRAFARWLLPDDLDPAPSLYEVLYENISAVVNNRAPDPEQTRRTLRPR